MQRDNDITLLLKLKVCLSNRLWKKYSETSRGELDFELPLGQAKEFLFYSALIIVIAEF